MPFVFAIALIDFLFSFSVQIACFSLKVSSLIFILCVCHCWMQDSEYRSTGYNWYDTFPAFNIRRINATGHSWSLRKTREATVPILMLTSDNRIETLKVLNFFYICVESPNNKMWHSVVLSHILLLIISVNVLTPQPNISLMLQYFWRALYIYTLQNLADPKLLYSCVFLAINRTRYSLTTRLWTCI